MLNRIFLLALSIVLLTMRVAAQESKRITTQQLAWVAYVNTLKFNEHWSLGTDVQERFFIDPIAQHQFLVRTHAARAVGNGWEVRMGGAIFFQHPHDPRSTSALVVPELRPHLEVNHGIKTSRMRVGHRYRFEARYIHQVTAGELSGGFAFTNYRFRYQVGIEVPLLTRKSGTGATERLYLRFFDEIFLNAGSKVVMNTFDQNRICIGLGYWTCPSLSIELGYLNWFQQLSTGADYYSRHIIRLAVVQRIDLSMKNEPAATGEP